jgi:hypothetical protein
MQVDIHARIVLRKAHAWLDGHQHPWRAGLRPARAAPCLAARQGTRTRHA